ncbi:hypothetical protein [Actinocorallia longicatena]|uniref:Uncharacterized protein n=1 Tax=Actinocorallia longicatena TaxID=111803 RepID=A0ABP6QD07_9ACTN
MPTPDHAPLQLLHPTWHIRPSRTSDYLIATRLDRTHLTDEELTAGLCMTLVADTLPLLTLALSEQSTLESP